MMKDKRWAVIWVAAFLTACQIHQPAIAPAISEQEQTHNRNVLIIQYDAAVGKQALLDAIKRGGAQVLYDYTIINAIAIKLPQNQSLAQAMADYQKVKGVLGVEEDGVMQLH